jgi:hypothetical protein
MNFVPIIRHLIYYCTHYSNLNELKIIYVCNYVIQLYSSDRCYIIKK